MDYQEKIQSLGLVVPPAPKPVGSYVPYVIQGNTAYVSGQVSKDAQGGIYKGRLGADLTIEQGKEAAKLAALNIVSIIRDLIGFQKFVRVLKVVGYVQVSPDFGEIPQVINGASDLFTSIFGEAGSHARAAVGVAALPLNAAVEIETILQVKS